MLNRANAPVAVFKSPLVSLNSARAPIGVEVTVCGAPERQKTNAGIVCAGGQTEKTVLSLRGVTTGIAAIGRRADGLRLS